MAALPLELSDFVDRETWTYAKTMPKWLHEYLVRERGSDEDQATRLAVVVTSTRTPALPSIAIRVSMLKRSIFPQTRLLIRG